jgi:hypothetical protein
MGASYTDRKHTTEIQVTLQTPDLSFKHIERNEKPRNIELKRDDANVQNEPFDVVSPFERSQSRARQFPSPNPNWTEKKPEMVCRERQTISAKWQRYAANASDAEN